MRDTCKVIWDLLHEEFIPHPSPQQWEEIATKFMEVTNFPNCIGALDGKHIRIKKPSHSGSLYYNYKKYFSIVIMAIADAQYKFVAVDIGAYGRTNDSRVFKTSAMGRRLYSGNFGIPSPRPLPGNDSNPMPMVVVADEAFQMCGNLLKPYASRGLNFRKKIFNYRLTRARRLVECAFGILTGKWRVFTTSIQLQPQAVDDVIKACVVLHNFVLTKEPCAMEQDEIDCPLSRLASAAPRSSTAVSRIRDTFAEYFLSNDGWLDWQDSMI